MPSIAKTASPRIPAAAQRSSASPFATTKARCRRCAPAADTTRSPRRSSRASGSFDAAAHDRQAERHRLLVEDADLFRQRRARLQLGPRPHAAIATGANAANRELTYIGISGDGDSLSIGLGHLCHAIRRNVNMLYVIENNGVYGLTKGQFSASADVGSKSKRARPTHGAHRSVLLGLSLGATFVARSFSGDKEQLVPILKAGLSHRGFALVDVISPCVTFNDHEGSTKSYTTPTTSRH
jgi:hypothetical protein